MHKLPLLAACSMLALGGCSFFNGTSTALTLNQVQQQSENITAAVNAANTLAQESTTLTAAQKALATQAVTTIDAANSTVQSLTQGASVAKELTAFDEAAQSAMVPLAAVFAINPATASAIELGLGLKDAFIDTVTAGAGTGSPNLALRPSVVPVPVPVNHLGVVPVPLPVHQP